MCYNSYYFSKNEKRVKELISIFILSSVIIAVAFHCYLQAITMPVIGVVTGAVLFSTALLLIKEYKLKLFTSTIKDLKDFDSFKFNLKALVFNLIGSQTFLLFGNDVAELQITKLAYSNADLFVDSLFCGMIITLATRTQDKLITVLCIVTFVMCGFEHTIVNFCLFAGVVNFEVLAFLVVNLVGNSVGAIVTGKVLERC